ncbi:hypothetical protein L227DRAFT_580618 [Lentinus tigrinus ALCF2SS1-6]|uniref:Uncharacterized protein n=1 Tax=Lentinus tigrinus ALCF2SS1-6 TaxID=1328759 RepID=A0A5C2RRY9_9APHY|nr:hypothetical protein L227DRAFT_580618 [Lentinus tigrinus ALCF2SS1-6]
MHRCTGERRRAGQGKCVGTMLWTFTCAVESSEGAAERTVVVCVTHPSIRRTPPSRKVHTDGTPPHTIGKSSEGEWDDAGCGQYGKSRDRG